MVATTVPTDSEQAFRGLGVSVSAGIIAGALVGGIGGRIAMRISAIASDSDGVLTEGGNRVGDITIGGTIALVVFGGIFTGLFGGLLLFVLRPWLSRRAYPRALALAVVLPLIAAATIIAPENADFLLLDPPELNIALFVALFVAFGPVVVAAETLVERRVPPAALPERHEGGAITAGVLLGPAAILALIFFADELVLVAAFVLLLGVATVARSRAAAGISPAGRLQRGAPYLGYGALVGACLSGAGYLAHHVAEIS